MNQQQGPLPEPPIAHPMSSLGEGDDESPEDNLRRKKKQEIVATAVEPPAPPSKRLKKVSEAPVLKQPEMGLTNEKGELVIPKWKPVTGVPYTASCFEDPRFPLGLFNCWKMPADKERYAEAPTEAIIEDAYSFLGKASASLTYLKDRMVSDLRGKRQTETVLRRFDGEQSRWNAEKAALEAELETLRKESEGKTKELEEERTRRYSAENKANDEYLRANRAEDAIAERDERLKEQDTAMRGLRNELEVLVQKMQTPLPPPPPLTASNLPAELKNAVVDEFRASPEYQNELKVKTADEYTNGFLFAKFCVEIAGFDSEEVGIPDLDNTARVTELCALHEAEMAKHGGPDGGSNP